jgi:hypothetical protein
MRASFPNEPPTNTTGVANLAFLAMRAHPDFRDEFATIYHAYLVALKRKYEALMK